ncbi:MAG TPA: hypothetical protein VD908_00010 [Cytophagales bacterium]|nr:hypothetical protein [Cytophagales bacterium]
MNSYPFYPNFFKKLGVFISSTSFVSVVTLNYFAEINVPFQILNFFICLGLFLTATSKEKEENKKTHEKRYTALKLSFIFSFSLLIALELYNLFSSSPLKNPSFILVAMIGLIFYLIIFNFLLIQLKNFLNLSNLFSLFKK